MPSLPLTRLWWTPSSSRLDVAIVVLEVDYHLDKQSVPRQLALTISSTPLCIGLWRRVGNALAAWNCIA
eukprot:4467408-Karenia_brevis.AAC.1